MFLVKRYLKKKKYNDISCFSYSTRAIWQKEKRRNMIKFHISHIPQGLCKKKKKYNDISCFSYSTRAIWQKKGGFSFLVQRYLTEKYTIIKCHVSHIQ